MLDVVAFRFDEIVGPLGQATIATTTMTSAAAPRPTAARRRRSWIRRARRDCSARPRGKGCPPRRGGGSCEVVIYFPTTPAVSSSKRLWPFGSDRGLRLRVAPEEKSSARVCPITFATTLANRCCPRSTLPASPQVRPPWLTGFNLRPLYRQAHGGHELWCSLASLNRPAEVPPLSSA